MIIGKEEHDLLVLDAELYIKRFQVVTEAGLTVSSAQCYLKHLEKSTWHEPLLAKVIIYSDRSFKCIVQQPHSQQ